MVESKRKYNTISMKTQQSISAINDKKKKKNPGILEVLYEKVIYNMKFNLSL